MTNGGERVFPMLVLCAFLFKCFVLLVLGYGVGCVDGEGRVILVRVLNVFFFVFFWIPSF